MEPKILSQSPVSLAELKEDIAKMKKREGDEPSIRITKMEDYLNAFSPLSAAKQKELIASIKKLDVPRLKDEHVIKISDLLPKTVDELKVVLQGYVVSVTNENLKKIVDAVKAVAK
jgi:DNA-directed RNA polymerase subunit F